jgi:uncharacterized membrane protein YcaP (DUF421 family)
MEIWPNDWGAILVPEGPVAELLVRGTVMYFFLYVLMRMAGRRLFARLAMSDILVMMLIAVAVREGITGEHYAIGDAMVSGATILAWDIIVDRIAFRFPSLRRTLRHRPVPIVRDGQLIVENARAHLLTRTEIMERVREEGLSALAQVQEAYMEPSGTLSIVPRSVSHPG